MRGGDGSSASAHAFLCQWLGRDRIGEQAFPKLGKSIGSLTQLLDRCGRSWLVAKIAASEWLKTGLRVKQKRNGTGRARPLKKDSVEDIQPVGSVIGVGPTDLLHSVDHRIRQARFCAACVGK